MNAQAHLDEELMRQAIDVAWQARHRSSPNPWVGAVLAQTDGTTHTGSTQTFGGDHAEVVALNKAKCATGATLYTTLEPCNHQGKTGPCTQSIIRAGVSRVVVAISDPDEVVGGAGLRKLRQAGIELTVGVGETEVASQLAPYLHHRRTGLPWVVLKMALTLDGFVAAPDLTSQWITQSEARINAHQLRAYSDAILVGAGTVRADNPSLRVRLWPGEDSSVDHKEVRNPKRIVLGDVPADARINPCESWKGSLEDLLRSLGKRQIVQLLVEGGPTVAHAFHSAGLVDQYICYLAPALMGGSDGKPAFGGPGAQTIADTWRAKFECIQQLGEDLRIDLLKAPS